ncbi:Acetyltransferase [Candidatus Sulfopaludibacter sp. SbA4]|nr:Acetyltransferase [Candidatus Sulfopaludibacter sp. SbA4]
MILGGGGHAKVVIDILEQAGEVEIAGFVSLAGEPAICGYPRLGSDDALDDMLRAGVQSAFVAIGDNQRRMDCIGSLQRQGFHLINAISPAAIVSRHATLCQGIAVMPGAVINAGSRIEDGAIVNTNASVDHDCVIGTCAHVAPGTTLAGCVRLGEGVFLGTGSSVIPNITIGSWTTVGAGAVVLADLPDHVVAVGVPAEVRKSNRGKA